jgi:hypothetical protein
MHEKSLKSRKIAEERADQILLKFGTEKYLFLVVALGLTNVPNAKGLYITPLLWTFFTNSFGLSMNYSDESRSTCSVVL